VRQNEITKALTNNRNADRCRTLGMLVPSLDYWPDVARGAEEEATRERASSGDRWYWCGR
jgi:hypothetical protein